jgi:hypothetical protein
MEAGLDDNEEQFTNQIKASLSKYENYIRFGRTSNIMTQGLYLIEKSITEIETKTL